MKKLYLALFVMLALAASPSYAKDKDKNKDKKGNAHHSDDRDGVKRHRDGDHDRDRDDDKKDVKRHRDGDHDRDDNRGPSKRPAGWDKGKKTGWGDCDVPPGQAKKVGCNGARRRVSTRDRNHRVARTPRTNVGRTNDGRVNRRVPAQTAVPPPPSKTVRTPSAQAKAAAKVSAGKARPARTGAPGEGIPTRDRR